MESNNATMMTEPDIKEENQTITREKDKES